MGDWLVNWGRPLYLSKKQKYLQYPLLVVIFETSILFLLRFVHFTVHITLIFSVVLRKNCICIQGVPVLHKFWVLGNSRNLNFRVKWISNKKNSKIYFTWKFDIVILINPHFKRIFKRSCKVNPRKLNPCKTRTHCSHFIFLKMGNWLNSHYSKKRFTRPNFSHLSLSRYDT